MIDWRVWSIAANRYKRVVEFLEDADFVEDFLYPVVEKEYNTKAGRKKRYVPLYSNYVFIKYNANIENNLVLQNCAWIVRYVGKCSEKEVDSVKTMDKSSYALIIPTEEIYPGTLVKMVKTPFAGWDAYVVEQTGNKLLVRISIFKGERIIKCKVDDVNIVE